MLNPRFSNKWVNLIFYKINQLFRTFLARSYQFSRPPYLEIFMLSKIGILGLPAILGALSLVFPKFWETQLA